MPLFSVKRRLRATATDLQRARQELAELQAQSAAFGDVADDTALDAIVRGDGEAARVGREAARHAERAKKAEETLTQRIAVLERRLDALLDRLPSEQVAPSDSDQTALSATRRSTP